MKQEKKTTIIRTLPVTWVGDQVTAFQTSAERQFDNGRTVRILGDPQSTVEKAEDSFFYELELWRTLITEADASFK